MTNWQEQLSQLVYSTETGRVDQDEKDPNELLGETFKDGMLRLVRQTKGRKGKGVIIIQGLQLSESEFKSLAKTLKNKCGTGGTVKDGTIEIQGDDRHKLQQVLESLGYKCKLAGG
jgi:translation initiation factor 1